MSIFGKLLGTTGGKPGTDSPTIKTEEWWNTPGAISNQAVSSGQISQTARSVIYKDWPSGLQPVTNTTVRAFVLTTIEHGGGYILEVGGNKMIGTSLEEIWSKATAYIVAEKLKG
jgi:hypothetical protein